MLWREYNNVKVGVSSREGYYKGVGKAKVWNRTGDIHNVIDVEDDWKIRGNREWGDYGKWFLCVVRVDWYVQERGICQWSGEKA